jgi:CRP/FNR family cyclic AMP-dependent transcriptional regulator
MDAPRTVVRSLLELDSDLGQLLGHERRQTAERELRVRVLACPVGEWDRRHLTDADPAHLGLIVAEGVLAREVVLEDTVSTELLGPGDIVRPWHFESETQLLPVTVRWNALSDVQLGLIDARTAVALARYPEINVMLVDRAVGRAQRLAITQAISQLKRVDRRLLSLFWHLAERWGRVARDGIAVPLVLSHRLLGELVGARRPTVSTALAELARHGQLVRRDDATWLLTGEPVTVTAEAAGELIRQRRRLMPEVAGHAAAPTADTRLAELRSSIEAARRAAERNREALGVLQTETLALRERTLELRASRRHHIEALRAAARRDPVTG